MAPLSCSPPESWFGSRSAFPPRPTRVSASRAAASFSLDFMLQMASGSMTFSTAVRYGIRLKDWNTKPSFWLRKSASFSPESA